MLFPIEQLTLEAITKSIRDHGFDWERPLMVWKNGDELVVIDGHTRLDAARKARLKEVPCVLRKFPDERAALDYAIREQRDRRNMSREQQAAYVLRVVEALDRPAQGERTDFPPDGGKSGAERTAELAGTSVRQVERARRVKGSGDEQVKQAVRNGKLTLAKAEREIAAKPAERKSYPFTPDGIDQMAADLQEEKATAKDKEEDMNVVVLENLGEAADDALIRLRRYENEVDDVDVVAWLTCALDALDRLVAAAETARVGRGG
jgi:ParB-like chromosome segregation protein Spo0J